MTKNILIYIYYTFLLYIYYTFLFIIKRKINLIERDFILYTEVVRKLAHQFEQVYKVYK